MEDSGSSLDGELDNFGLQDSSKIDENSFGSLGQSPQRKRDAIAESMTSIHRVSETGVWVTTADEQARKGRRTLFFNTTIRLNLVWTEFQPPFHTANLDLIETYLPACARLNNLLYDRGFAPISLTSNDVEPQSKTISAYILDAWAESVLTALEELLEREQTRSSTAVEVSYTARANDVSREGVS